MAEQYFGGKGRRRKSRYELLQDERKMRRSFEKADKISEMSKQEAETAKKEADQYLEKELDTNTSTEDSEQ